MTHGLLRLIACQNKSITAPPPVKWTVFDFFYHFHIDKRQIILSTPCISSTFWISEREFVQFCFVSLRQKCGNILPRTFLAMENLSREFGQHVDLCDESCSCCWRHLNLQTASYSLYFHIVIDGIDQKQQLYIAPQNTWNPQEKKWENHVPPIVKSSSYSKLLMADM